MSKRNASPPPQAVPPAYVVQVVPSRDGQRDALAMENLLQSLASDEPFSLELIGNVHRQAFLLRAGSKSTLESLCRQLQAQYPQADIRRKHQSVDPLRLAPDERAATASFVLRTHSFFPIKTFWDREISEPGTDPMLGLLAGMEPMRPNERIVTQVSLVSAPDSWVKRDLRKTVEHPLTQERDRARMASSPQGAALGGSADLFLLVGGLIAAGLALQGYLWWRHHAWPQLALLVVLGLAAALGLLWWWWRKETVIYDMRLIQTKLMRVAFYASVHVIVIGKASTSSEEQLRGHIKRMELAFRQFDLSAANGFLLKDVRVIEAGEQQAVPMYNPERAFTRPPLVRHLRGWSKYLLNAREVASLWHLPQSEAEVPLIERRAMKVLLASPGIYAGIQQAPAILPAVYLGDSKHRGYKVPVRLPEAALLSTHKLLVGTTGTGKSTLEQLLATGAMQPVPAGCLQPGTVVIDPHGDLVMDCLHQIPARRSLDDVDLFDLEDQAHPPGLNLLDATMGFTPDQAVNNVMDSFSRIWSEFWGPRMSYVLKHCLLTLAVLNAEMVRKDPGKRGGQFTLLDVNPLLQHLDFTKEVLAMLDETDTQQKELLAWWRDFFFKLPPNSTFRQEVISPVVSKIGVFSDNPVLRCIVGQPVSTVDVSAAVTAGKICLVNLASSRIEFDAAAVIGGTLCNLLHRHLSAQARFPLALRRRVLICVDEFHNLPGADFESLLSDDRKYGCAMLLATQSLVRLEQIKKGLGAITFSNCQQIFAFATSAADAKILQMELHEQVEQADIMSQPPLHCYVRLTLPGHPIQVASLELVRPEAWQRTPESSRRAGAIRTNNQGRHLARKRVEQDLTDHSNLYLDLSQYADGLRKDAKKRQDGRALRKRWAQQAAAIATAPTIQMKPGTGPGNGRGNGTTPAPPVATPAPTQAGGAPGATNPPGGHADTGTGTAARAAQTPASTPRTKRRHTRSRWNKNGSGGGKSGEQAHQNGDAGPPRPTLWDGGQH